jgi:hypothetical protein
MSKYQNWYDQITKRGQNRETKMGHEKHHIVPKSLGGSNQKSNLTHLTPREHFICHWLLVKIYAEGEPHWKMLNALRIMKAENKNQIRYKTKITSRVYEKLKVEYASILSDKLKGENNPMYGKKWTEKQKTTHSNKIKGRVQPLEEKMKQKRAITGRKRPEFSQEWRENLSQSAAGEKNGMWGKNHSEETKQKQREKATGRKQSIETVLKKADAIRGSKREKKICSHCNTPIAVNVFSRWHGDNCKSKRKENENQ